jgi:hypothetical protein
VAEAAEAVALALRAAAMRRWDGVRPAAVDAFEYCSGGKDEVRACEDVAHADGMLMNADGMLMASLIRCAHPKTLATRT